MSVAMRTTEAHNVLKVEKGASQDEIRRACRREALRWHPDKNMGNTEAAARSFQHVQEAVLALRENNGESCKENLRIDCVMSTGQSFMRSGGGERKKDGGNACP